MEYPPDRKYSREHEWVATDGDTARVGITDYAQDALGDVVFVKLPEVGDVLDQGGTAGEVESTKSVSEVYAPVAGTVVEVNTELDQTPERLNDDPYGEGWIFVVQPSAPDATSALLDAAAYRAIVEG